MPTGVSSIGRRIFSFRAFKTLVVAQYSCSVNTIDRESHHSTGFKPGLNDVSTDDTRLKYHNTMWVGYIGRVSANYAQTIQP